MRVVFLLFFLFSLSFAGEINLKSIKIKNLPYSYSYTFEDFFKKSILNLSKDEKNYFLEIEIQWMAYSYNFCFFVYEKENLIEAKCFNANNAQEILDGMKVCLEDDEFIKIKLPEKRKKINLLVKAKDKTDENLLRVISVKGDYLTPYLQRVEKLNQPFMDFYAKAVSVDLVVFKQQSSAYLLKKILNGYKIDKIMIKN